MAALSQGPERKGPAEHNLPVPLTSLVGRARELLAIGEALGRTRLVTLTGPGGVGKTRLAIELARRQTARRRDGVWIVDLTAAPGTPDVAAETARTLDVHTPPGRAADALRRYLRDRDLLLVLDNCEHVIDGCAELATGLLGFCADVRIMATSRESLNVNGETVWRLDPLGDEDARRLFLDRARGRLPDFMPDMETDTTIAQLCARLDRLPLGIELAAARVSAMSPAEILSGVEARLGDLAGSGRLSPAHHRSVRAAVEWSARLLDPGEQEAFRALAVFVGGFDAAAARPVAGLSLDLLARLVDKSLVAVVESRGGRTRYRLLEAVREYASELLVEAGELEAARERHLRHFSALADFSQAGWPTPRAQAVVGELAGDYENVRAALEWAAASDPCAARPLLGRTKDLFLLLAAADGRRLTELLLERCTARDRDRAELQITLGLLAMVLADVEAARSALAEAQQLSAELGERETEGWAHCFAGLTETLGGSIEPARRHLEAARALHGELGVPSGWARATAALGLTFLITNEPDRARELVERALAVDVAEEDDWGQGHCHVYLGVIAESTTTDPEAVTSHYREAVDRFRPFRGGPLLPAALIGQAGVLARREPARALRVIAAAYALRDRTGAGFAPYFGARAERIRAAAETMLGADAQRVWAEGARMVVDDAIALAFGTQRPRPAPTGGLSDREQEVASLVADGLSNKAIAARLHLSVRTVESHVRHALTKLGLVNRTQLARWVRERIQ
jgi:non-specific serine/threonine protein kinase